MCSTTISSLYSCLKV